MDNLPRFFIYEVRKRTGPVSHDFYCYVIYNTKTHQIAYYIKNEKQRAARRMCEELIGSLMFNDEAPIIVWRSWPILLWPDELNEQNMVEYIRKREVEKNDPDTTFNNSR